MKTILLSLIIWFFAQSVLLTGDKEPIIIQLDSQRELFVDHYLIETLNGARLFLQKPYDEGSIIKFDKPWEGAFCGYFTIIKDGETYRAYYRGMAETGKEDGSSFEKTCYAESKDGIHWEKPNLGLFEVNGTLENNVILANAAPVTHNFSPFIDTKAGVDQSRRFKALGGTVKSGLIAYVSADGIRWKKLQEKPVITKGMFDSQNVSFWSESEKCYLCYFRVWTEGGYKGFRTVSRTTSKDFIHWTDPVEMNFGDTPHEHIYTTQTHPYFRAPHIYVAIAARFMPGRQVLTDEQAEKLNVNPKYFKDCSDAIFMTSRGGNVYDRTFMESFIRAGIGFQNWVSRSNYPALNVVQTSATEMSIYVKQDYAQPTAHLRRYSMRLDGFVSINAPYKGGEMITKPFTFSGKNLSLNFATSAAGEIQVEIQDENGKAFANYSLADSQPMIGNEIERVVVWKNGTDVSHLAGKPIRLRFVMKDADLYSMMFQ
jgi:hypothetical protein